MAERRMKRILKQATGRRGLGNQGERKPPAEEFFMIQS